MTMQIQDLSHIKRLSFAFDVLAEDENLGRSIDHAKPLYVTTPWWELICFESKWLIGADPEYVKVEMFDKYHGRMHFQVANGTAVYDLKYDVFQSMWIGTLITSTGAGGSGYVVRRG